MLGLWLVHVSLDLITSVTIPLHFFLISFLTQEAVPTLSASTDKINSHHHQMVIIIIIIIIIAIINLFIHVMPKS